jgi:hypothetical protein
MADVYRMVGEKPPGVAAAAPAAPAAPAAAAVGPYQFDDADISNPYAMKWDAYSTKLKTLLDSKYSAGRAQPSPQKVKEADQEQPAPATDRGSAIRSLKAFIKANKPEGVRPPSAAGINGWSNGSIDRLVDAAAAALPPEPADTPFNRANFLNSIRPLMADQARQNKARGVGNNGIVANPLFPFSNIGV